MKEWVEGWGNFVMCWNFSPYHFLNLSFPFLIFVGFTYERCQSKENQNEKKIEERWSLEGNQRWQERWRRKRTVKGQMSEGKCGESRKDQKENSGLICLNNDFTSSTKIVGATLGTSVPSQTSPAVQCLVSQVVSETQSGEVQGSSGEDDFSWKELKKAHSRSPSIF